MRYTTLLKFSVLFCLLLFQSFAWGQNYEIKNNASGGSSSDGVYIYSQMVSKTSTRWWKARMDCNGSTVKLTLAPSSGMGSRCNINVSVIKIDGTSLVQISNLSYTCGYSEIGINIPSSQLPSIGNTLNYALFVQPIGNACDNGELCVGVDGVSSAGSGTNRHIITNFEVKGVSINSNACNFSTLSFSNSNSELTANFTENISSSDKDKIRYLLWDFGDGNTEEYEVGENPSHLYAANGNYNVTMTAVGNCCSESVTRNISVACSTVPIPNFTYSRNGLTVNFTSTANPVIGSLKQYNWDFGDGNFAYTANPTHTYANKGKYPVKHTVFNTCNRGESIVDTILVCNTFEPKLAASPNPISTNVFPGQSIRFYSSNPDITIYNWFIGISGTSDIIYRNNTTQARVSFTQAGSYYATLEAINTCGEYHRESISFTVNETPVVEINEHNPNNTHGADPVNLATGAFVWGHNALPQPSIFGTIYFRFFYNSRFDYQHVLGHNWTHNFDIRLETTSDRWTLRQADGSKVYFIPDESGGSQPLRPHTKDSLYYDGIYYVLKRRNGTQYRFYNWGLPYQITPLNGQTVTFNYNT